MTVRHTLIGIALALVFFFLTGLAEGLRVNQLTAASGVAAPSHIIGLFVLTAVVAAALASVPYLLRSTAAPLAFAAVLSVLVISGWSVEGNPMGVTGPLHGFYWFDTAMRAANSPLTAGALGAAVAVAAWNSWRARKHAPTDVRPATTTRR